MYAFHVPIADKVKITKIGAKTFARESCFHRFTWVLQHLPSKVLKRKLQFFARFYRLGALVICFFIGV
jgi:hypothetical protein